MLDIVAILLALLSFGFALALARVVVDDRKRVMEELAALRQDVRMAALPGLPTVSAPNPLEGLRIGISIKQDHEQSTFADFLKDRLAAEDAEGVVLSPGVPGDGFDLLINGSLTCNGYAEAYYSADIACLAGTGLVFKIAERPAEGGRQSNLAAGLVGKLKKELEQSASRSERIKALREIRE